VYLHSFLSSACASQFFTFKKSFASLWTPSIHRFLGLPIGLTPSNSHLYSASDMLYSLYASWFMYILLENLFPAFLSVLTYPFVYISHTLCVGFMVLL
jgi:hypothetical protein